jgi:histidinol phosphatase-like PHP family hydrolase
VSEAAAPVAWQPLDCHAHTTMSDGALSVAELEAVVRARGARPSVADHVSRDVNSAVKTREAFAAYTTELERHPGVMRGAEFCWHDSLWRELTHGDVAHLTHTLGSLHAVHLPDGDTLHAFARRWPEGLTADAYMDAHVADLERLCREMPVDIHSHPTLLPLHLRERPLEELWTEEREERAVEALEAAGIAFEISNRYRVHQRFVQRAFDGGVRLSLGSDGHGREQVGDVAWPLAVARYVGARDGDLYDPAVHGSRVTRTR